MQKAEKALKYCKFCINILIKKSLIIKTPFSPTKVWAFYVQSFKESK